VAARSRWGGARALQDGSREIEHVYYIYVVEDEKLLASLAAGPADEEREAPVGGDAHEAEDGRRRRAGYGRRADLQVQPARLPVVDEEDRLLGVVTVDDVVDLLLRPPPGRGAGRCSGLQPTMREARGRRSPHQEAVRTIMTTVVVQAIR